MCNCRREEGLLCEHDSAVRVLKARVDAIFEMRRYPKFVWCPGVLDRQREIYEEAVNQFGNDGKTGEPWDGRF